MIEVRCCCEPGLVIGEISREDGFREGLRLRELDDGTSAFDSEDRSLEEFAGMIGFFEKHTKGTKTWKKK